MKLITRVAIPVLAAAAFAGIAGIAGTSAAIAAEVSPVAPVRMSAAAAQSLTQGFEIRNLSSHVITLNGITNPGNGDGTPRVGTVLKPGMSMHYEKVFWFGNTPVTTLTIQQHNAATGTSTLFQIELKIDPFLNIPSVIAPDSGVGDLVFGDTGRGSNQINFKDQPGHAPITVSPADKQQQAELLNTLCAGGQAACTFTPTGTTDAPDNVQRKLTDKNIGTGPVTINFKQAFTFGTTTSVELTASGKSSVLGLVELTLTGKYGRGWSESTTEEITRSFQVPAGRQGIVEVSQPMIREIGTFSVTMGDTLWELTDVYFDFPDKTKSPVVNIGDIAA